MSLAHAPGSRSSRTRWPRRSVSASSTSCTARASHAKALSSTSESTWRSSRRPAPGSPTRVSSWVKGVRTPGSSWPSTPTSGTRSSGRCARRSVSPSSVPKATRRPSRSSPMPCSTRAPQRRRWQSQGQGRGRGIGLGAVDPSPSRGAPQPQDLPRTSPRAPGGPPTKPPGARTPTRWRPRSIVPRSMTSSLRLERVGLVDDEAFARQMADYQYGSRRAGRRAVTGALMEKGIAPEVIAQVIDDAPDDEDRARPRTRRVPSRAHGRPRSRQGLQPSHRFAGSPRLQPRRGSQSCPHGAGCGSGPRGGRRRLEPSGPLSHGVRARTIVNTRGTLPEPSSTPTNL